jgi:hypothetical protein
MKKMDQRVFYQDRPLLVLVQPCQGGGSTCASYCRMMQHSPSMHESQRVPDTCFPDAPYEYPTWSEGGSAWFISSSPLPARDNLR